MHFIERICGTFVDGSHVRTAGCIDKHASGALGELRSPMPALCWGLPLYFIKHSCGVFANGSRVGTVPSPNVPQVRSVNCDLKRMT